MVVTEKYKTPRFLVVLDTNVLIYGTHLLSNPLSQSLFHSLKTEGGRVVLPEIVEKETLRNAVKCCLDAFGKHRDTSRILDTFWHPVVVSKEPTREEIEEKVQTRFKELSELLIRASLSPSQLQKAFEHVVAELPPNGPGNQQFKDSVLWAVILDFLKTAPVYFITLLSKIIAA
jgi:hypothetical protein